jgi:hypothetical protein
MKLIATLIATLFAVSAFAAEPAKKEEAKPAAPAASAPAKAEAKKEVKPAKSEPAKKDAPKADAKAATPAK